MKTNKFIEGDDLRLDKTVNMPTTLRDIPLDVCPTCSYLLDHCSCSFETHSGSEGMKILENSMKSQQENITFRDGAEEYEINVDSNVDPTRMLQDSNEATLADFFKRPVKIFHDNWVVGAAFDHDINPWKLYFENPRVINRIANFNLLRARLKVKVVVNGNGFL
jgi:hypothetical protein